MLVFLFVKSTEYIQSRGDVYTTEYKQGWGKHFTVY